MALTTGTLSGSLPYVSFGTGPRPLIVLPGASDPFAGPIEGLSAWALRYYYRRFTDSHTIYVVRRPRGMDDATTIDSMATDCAVAIDDRFDEPVDLLGLSMGGCIAQLVAAEHHGLVDRVVLAVSGCRLGERGTAIVDRWRGYAESNEWDVLYRESVALTYSGWRRFLYGAVGSIPGYSPAVPPIASDVRVTFDALCGFDACDRIGSIDAPTLVIGGDEDPFFPTTVLRETAERTGARLFLYPGGGHGVTDERKRSFESTVLEFMR